MGTMAIASLVLSTGITSACLQVVTEKLANLTLEWIGRNVDVEDKLQQLGRTLLRIQSLVDDVENKHSISTNCQLLIEDFKGVILDADDLLEKIDQERMISGDIGLSAMKWDVKDEVSQMVKKVGNLVIEMEGYFLSEINKLRPPQTLAIPRTSSLVDELCVIGRDQEKREIVGMLLANRTQTVSLISIVGMGGIGKTTLAQLAYNDAAVVRSFDLRMWVCVSLDSDLVNITKSIFESATSQVSELSNLDSVQIQLQGVMRSKKFLLVLDDMWNENPNFWDDLALPFGGAALGSRVMVTTRSQIVSTIVLSSGGAAYPLHTLPDHRVCWRIIQKHLSTNLVHGQDNLEEIGLEIAKKCKGLPLAAKVIGNVLRFKSRKMEWDAILNCDLWDFPEDYKNRIYPVLKLSYDHLPAYLKRCFAYCSIFPHNFQFEEDDLIQLWAAEGFIQSKITRRTEDIGREYFDLLCSRSFLQESSKSTGHRTYEMHDFFHDLARLVSTNLCFRLDDSTSCLLPVSRNVRHSSLLCENIHTSTLEEFHRYDKLRTFILLPKYASNLYQVPHDYFSKLPCLRVLNLSCSCISELPESIGMLMRLRYLNLNNTLIRKLPKSLGNLYGLEILKLKNCFRLRELPENLKNLIKLRHLDFDRYNQISSIPKEVGKLTSLETLHEFRVGIDKGCQIEELKNMRCLRGSFCIKNLENVPNRGNAETAILHDKKFLESLGLHWKNGTRDATVEQEVLAGLKPHDKLKSLQIIGYLGSNFPDWIGSSSFCKLESIHLEKCRVCAILPSLGQLPLLKELVIEEMGALKDVDHNFCGATGTFPSLKKLTFRDMPELQVWSGINERGMPRLTDLSIDSCPNLVALPSVHHLTSLETLVINRCPQLQSIPDHGLPNSLKSLIISESDILKERCEADREDWNKIRFIPEVVIDDVNIPTEGRVI